MKILWLFVFLLGLSGIGCQSESSARQQKEGDEKVAKDLPEIGRYQLVNGEYTRFTEFSKKSEILVKAIFKIDTATGDVWVYQPSILGNKNEYNHDAWVPSGK